MFQPFFDQIIASMTLKISKWYKRHFVYHCMHDERQDMLTYVEMNAGPEHLFYYQIAKSIIIIVICLLTALLLR